MNGMLYSIGEVSRVTGISVKALRLYQEKGLLEPARIDARSGYRYYSERDLERAHAIRALRDLCFSMEEIGAVLAELDAGAPLGVHLQRTRARLAQELAGTQRSLLAIEELLRHEERAQAYLRAPPTVGERELGPLRIATFRTRGRYSDAGEVFPRLFAACGADIAGPPFCLYHDAEYKEEDADISWCVPIAAASTPAGVAVEELPVTRAVTVVHTGAWSSVGPSWARLFAHVRSREEEPGVPLRETYLHGPGRSDVDPSSYVTELAVIVGAQVSGVGSTSTNPAQKSAPSTAKR